MTPKEADHVQTIAAALADTATLCTRRSGNHRKLTPEEVAARLEDCAKMLQALSRGEL